MNRFASLLLLLTLTALGCRAQAPERSPDTQEAAPDTAYTTQTPSRDGTGRVYMGREIAQVMGHRGAAWLERPERERQERTDLLVNALDLEPDDVVADLGAGTGYFTFRIAPRVPEGRVLAVDIQPEMLSIIETRAERENLDNVAPIWGTETDPTLQDAVADLTLIVDAYHEFSHPREMLNAIYESTKPGGRLVLVEYRAEDPDVPIKPLHTMTEEQVRREVEAAGFRFVENRDFLPQQHFLVFKKPEG